jgi:hypothetical protein
MAVWQVLDGRTKAERSPFWKLAGLGQASQTAPGEVLLIARHRRAWPRLCW